MAKKVSEAEAAQAADATVADQADAAAASSGEGAGPSATDAQQSGVAAGTNSTDTTQSEAENGGGGGVNAASAGAIIAAGREASAEQLGQVSDYMKGEEAKFRSACPHLAKAIDSWTATNAAPPRGVRIVSLVEGFRRAGKAFGREATEHRIEEFALPASLEALFAEPKLAVTFI